MTIPDVVQDFILHDKQTGNALPFRVLMKSNGAMVEIPMSKFVIGFSPEREEIRRRNEADERGEKEEAVPARA
jgi:hypothetical protein